MIGTDTAKLRTASPEKSPGGAGRDPVVLAIDVGGNHAKFLTSDTTEKRRRFTSGPAMTPAAMVAQVRDLAAGWTWDVASVGYPGPVVRGKVMREPHNLGPGWVGFDFEAALGCPVKLMNDAAMQALGSYQGGAMLFLGLGTGLGAALIVRGELAPLELGRLPYKKATFEDYVGQRGLEAYGKKKWREDVADVTARLIAALLPEDVVLGGGNASLLDSLPPGCRAGANANAFIGGFRAWGVDIRRSRPERQAP